MTRPPMADHQAWQVELDARQVSGVGLEFDPANFAQAVGAPWPHPDLQAFLDDRVQQGSLSRLDLPGCPRPGCHQILSPEMLEAGECPSCALAFTEQDELPQALTHYRLDGAPSRDLRWMIVVHGMNTRGVWQEDFSWLIANRLKYSAPILIYKYGWATVDVLARWIHHRLAKRLGQSIRKAADYARSRGLPAAPDILVHSFGSRLFSLILLDETFADLRFGRVITAGSIIQPDFNWSSLIAAGRIEAVLNHVGGKDSTVPWAQFFIPGTGPGGRIGYLDETALNQRSVDFDHSAALTEASLKAQLDKGGEWDRFLTMPTGQYRPSNPWRPDKWSPAPVLLRAPVRLLGWTILAVFGPFSYLRRKLDA
jgi:hypothetical protein